jgi:hypothetical protein
LRNDSCASAAPVGAAGPAALIQLVSVAVAAVGSVAGYALVRSRDFVAGGGPAAAPEPAQA